MPGGIVPHQQPVPLALGYQALATVLQKLGANGTHQPSRDKAQPDLRTIRVVERSRLPQNAIAGERLGVRVVLLPGLFDQANRMLFALPNVNKGLAKIAPPDFVQKADRKLLLGLLSYILPDQGFLDFSFLPLLALPLYV